MELLAIEKDIHAAVPVSTELLRAEALRVHDLEQQGILRRIWFRADRTAAVLLLEAESVEAARAALATLPLVAAGAVDFDVVPLTPYPGLARLWT